VEKRGFKSYSIQDFQHSLENLVKMNREITHIQIHHTWKPRKTDYNGESTIFGMWRYHTETRGWSDIGQHFSIAPDGLIWDGRPLDKDPAGISGHNKGGVMFEIIGNFDEGEEKLEGIQLKAVVEAIKCVMKRFNLTKEDIVFHREHSSKTCPGSGLPKDWLLKQLSENTNHEDWKMEGINWMYEHGLLTGDQWKNNINEPLPLWAEAIVLKRLFEKLDS
jgi:hypothetical protein